jgi:hypothetical protein
MLNLIGGLFRDGPISFLILTHKEHQIWKLRKMYISPSVEVNYYTPTATQSSMQHGPYGLPLEYWSPTRLQREVIFNTENVIQWCQKNKLLAASRTCSGCHSDMLFVKHKGIDGYL